MMMSISTVFIFPFSSQNTQKENVGGVNVEHSIDVIDACLRELDSMVYHSTFYDVPYSYHTPFIHMSGQVDYWDLKLLMFPFLPWVCHWRYFLDANYKRIPSSVGLIDQLTGDLRYVKPLYEAFRTSSGCVYFLLTSTDSNG